jgi:hypothetical protein
MAAAFPLDQIVVVMVSAFNNPPGPVNATPWGARLPDQLLGRRQPLSKGGSAGSFNDGGQTPKVFRSLRPSLAKLQLSVSGA